MAKKSTSQFISEAMLVHGDRYDYTNTIYDGVNSKVLIRCKEHGEFLQSPGSHLAGYKCRECGLDQQRQSSRLTFKDFVSRAQARHGEKYSYTEVDWVKSTSPITIRCEVHGDFRAEPYSHYAEGIGCPKCSKRPQVTTDDFIARAAAREYPHHDYSKTIYTNYSTKVIITCILHGDYQQNPGDHYRYPGCQKCRYIKSANTRSRDRSKTSLDGYGAQVKRYTSRSYKDHLDLINPLGLLRAKGSYELDHIFSIREGYENKVPPEVIGHYTNLRMLASSENGSKHSRCDKTIEDLYRDFNQATGSNLSAQ